MNGTLLRARRRYNGDSGGYTGGRLSLTYPPATPMQFPDLQCRPPPTHPAPPIARVPAVGQNYNGGYKQHRGQPLQVDSLAGTAAAARLAFTIRRRWLASMMIFAASSGSVQSDFSMRLRVLMPGGSPRALRHVRRSSPAPRHLVIVRVAEIVAGLVVLGVWSRRHSS